ncbi:hypothetical protein LVB77_08290 [Lysobacter sp. 5GHs7-4]|uniref:hypothetical protein n=1 Tax=Lysobacter sp. 5GHs7-4 TaxID=2904253 RepID=UPI001E3B6734|nr:hypothetical protein [Lysobacter sp. 5GHs7-4]UHQ24674.1 hypothetical protein LVB77_08290 [Lysobacter sp. 5GHs7-4]
MSILPVLGLLYAGSVQAQQQDGCPQLPSSTQLVWQHKPAAGSDVCLALREDGSEAFGMYISNKSPFTPKRGDRAEAGTIDGKPMYWYRGELAGKPDVQVRETLLDLGDGRVAHIWLQAPTPDKLGEVLGLTQGLRFPSSRLSSK